MAPCATYLSGSGGGPSRGRSAPRVSLVLDIAHPLEPRWLECSRWRTARQPVRLRHRHEGQRRRRIPEVGVYAASGRRDDRKLTGKRQPSGPRAVHRCRGGRRSPPIPKKRPSRAAVVLLAVWCFTARCGGLPLGFQLCATGRAEGKSFKAETPPPPLVSSELSARSVLQPAHRLRANAHRHHALEQDALRSPSAPTSVRV